MTGRGWVRVSVGNYRAARELMGPSGFTRGNWAEIYCVLPSGTYFVREN